VRGRRGGRFRRPGSLPSAGLVKSSSGPTGVRLPESSCPGGDWHPLRGAAGPVQRELKTLSQIPVVFFFPPPAGAVSDVSPSVSPCGFLRLAESPIPASVPCPAHRLALRLRPVPYRCATGRRHPVAARRSIARQSGTLTDRLQHFAVHRDRGTSQVCPAGPPDNVWLCLAVSRAGQADFPLPC
jgi:hypothetical protein